MSITRKALTNIGRLLGSLAVVMVVLCCVGCTSAPTPLRKLSVPFGNSKEQTLRKQVEADSFPTAKQAGL